MDLYHFFTTLLYRVRHLNENNYTVAYKLFEYSLRTVKNVRKFKSTQFISTFRNN